ncbi:MAG: flagellar basal body rod protein FlgC [Verrucomicrobia bacterium]|jgi:flagellar basal-body rod protein FlgC|nr:flagellar basal body rod protein FlgC [Verrucomicrobiota bacterium]
MDLLAGIENSAAALEAQKFRMDIISQNIANAQTSRGLDGKPYQRKEVVFENLLPKQRGMDRNDMTSGPLLQVARIQHDQTPPRMVHMPGHPDADNNGMVAMPSINIHREMVDMISSSRAYEANLSVIRSARSMAEKAMAMGR